MKSMGAWSSNESHWLDNLTGYQDSNPNNGHQVKCPILTVEKLFCKIPKYANSAKIFLCHHCSISANGSQKCRTLLIFSSPVFSWGHVYLFCTSISVILGILMAELCWLPGPRLNIKTIFPNMGISMLKIRWSQDCLIFNMGIPTLVRRHLNNEMDPWLWLNIGHSGPRSSQCQAKCCCCLGWLDSMLDILSSQSSQENRAHFNIKTVFPGIGIPIIKVRHVFIIIIGILILVKLHILRWPPVSLFQYKDAILPVLEIPRWR